MNKKIVYAFLFIFSLSFFGAIHVFADENKGTGRSDDNGSKVETQKEVSDEDENEIEDSNDSSSVSGDKKYVEDKRGDDQKNEDDDMDDDSEKSSGLGDDHKADVAKVIEALKKLENRDQKVSDAVKAVVASELQSADIVKEKIETIEKRNKVKTFFIGTDYKNLGELRSEIAKTENNIRSLKSALEKATDPSVKTQLQQQIDQLTAIQTKTNSFVKEKESVMSLFGWFVKLFQ